MADIERSSDDLAPLRHGAADREAAEEAHRLLDAMTDRALDAEAEVERKETEIAELRQSLAQASDDALRLREALDTAVAEAKTGTRDSMLYAMRNLHGDVLADVERRLEERACG